MSWAWSNTPRTAMLWMFSSCSEYICARWKALMRPCGDSMNTDTPRCRAARTRPPNRCTGGRAQDVQRGAALAQHVFEDLAQELHGHVLNASVGPLGQAQQRQAAGQRAQRHDVLAVEDLRVVGRARQAAQVLGRDVGGEQRQHLERQIGVRQAAPGLQRRADTCGSCSGTASPPSGARPSSRMSENSSAAMPPRVEIYFISGAPRAGASPSSGRMAATRCVRWPG